jgi:hypothetical protein
MSIEPRLNAEQVLPLIYEIIPFNSLSSGHTEEQSNTGHFMALKDVMNKLLC